MKPERAPLLLRQVSVRDKITTYIWLKLAGLCFCVFWTLRFLETPCPTFIDHDFGVGFDLTIPYGTATVSFPNGTTINIAKIEGPAAYQEMMARLNLESSEHIQDLDDAFRDQPRQALRLGRKKAGLPATPDVGHLAQMILSLRHEVEIHMNRSISGGVVTNPHLPALYAEDLQDAFEYAKLLYLATWPYWYQDMFPESGAVYAGHGFGICANYTDRDACDKEKLPGGHDFENVLTVAYSNSMLASIFSHKSMWFSPAENDGIVRIRLDLGWGQRNKNPDESYYWEDVRRTILEPAVLAERFQGRPNKVIVHGDCSNEAKFRSVVEELVEKSFANKPPIYWDNPVYVGSRGAAEMAKIVWYRYNTTKRTDNETS